MPDWIRPLEGPGEAGLPVGLAGDLELASDPDLRELPCVWPLQLHDRDDAVAVSLFAQQAPDLFLQIVLDRLRRLDVSHAVLVDLADPATRIFARACRILDIARIYAPARRLDLPSDRPGIEQLSGEARAGICSAALVWTTAQRERLASCGLPREALIEVAPPDLAERRPVSRPATILIWLSNAAPWPDPEALTCFGQGFVDRAQEVGFRVMFLFEADMARRVPERLQNAIHLGDPAGFRILAHPADPLGPVIDDVDVVVTDRSRNALRAAAAGVPHLDMSRTLTEGDAVGSGHRLMKEMSDTVLRYLDGDADPVDAGPHVSASETAAAAVQRLARMPAGRVTRVIDDVIAGRDRDIGLAVGVLPEATPEGGNRHIKTLLGVRELRLLDRDPRLSEVMDADLFVQWGLRLVSDKRVVALASRRLQADLLIIDDGFVRSVETGLQGGPTCSIVMDDMGAFYDATRPSRLETILNGEMELDPAQRERAVRAMALLTATRVSKYNFAPYRKMPRSAGGRKVVLVVDQRAGDMSIELGMASQASFDAMLEEALALSGDHDVWIKTHPDATLGGYESAIGAAALAAAAERPNVTVIREDTNPYSLIEAADKVLVVTSGMGFEALLAGREVHCFGLPFYAGWGLTQDRLGLLRRRRARSLADIFYTFCITLSRYVDPETGCRCELEDLVRRMAELRPWRLEADAAPDPVAPDIASEMPATPAAAPLFEPEEVTTARLPSGGGDISEYRTLFVVHMAHWKQDYYHRILPEHDIVFLPRRSDILDISRQLATAPRPAFLIWGRNTIPGLQVFAETHDIPVFRTEDGFLRSVGLGANHILPYSVCLDKRGIYFDATKPSDLEVILQTFDFDGDPALMEEAARCRDLIVRDGLSKYNFAHPPVAQPFGPKTRRRVLVIGQVEDDASIRFGAPEGVTNNDLVRLARRENPDAQVVYKIHPDVLAGKRGHKSDPAEVEGICEIHSAALSLQNAFDEVDHVYSITSLAGFEALMRDIPVTTVGMPFYAGWGVTDDRANCPRRTRRLTRDQIFAGAYLLYARYADPQTGAPLCLEEVIGRIRSELADLRTDGTSA